MPIFTTEFITWILDMDIGEGNERITVFKELKIPISASFSYKIIPKNCLNLRQVCIINCD